MSKYTMAIVAMAGLLFSLAPSGASGQIIQSPTLNPESLDATESVRQGSVSARSPGRLLQAATERHREWQGLAFRGPHGTYSQEAAEEPSFYMSILNDVLQVFFDNLHALLFGLNSLNDLSGTLGDLLGT